MSWFNEVTGTNDYERQSWRDSYNGGRAAGDLTGATNARLDAERERFQGATWSGSSTQLSAIELAQSLGGPGLAAGNAGIASHGGGPASEVVTQGPASVSAPKGGTGPGASRLIISTPASMVPKNKQLERIGNGGPYESHGAISDFGWVNTGTGWVPVPSSDVKERIEDNLLMETSWFTRNYLTPMFVGGQEERIRPSFLDPEYSHYVPILNEWREGTFTRPGGYRTGGGF